MCVCVLNSHATCKKLIIPLSGTCPLLMSSRQCTKAIKPQAPAGQNTTPGMPRSSAISNVKVIVPSETMEVTRGSFDEQLSFVIRSRNGAPHFSIADSQIARMSCIGGSPSKASSHRIRFWSEGLPRSWRNPGPEISIDGCEWSEC